jgi:hypothetical protein
VLIYHVGMSTTADLHIKLLNMETGKYKIFFRLWPTVYFLGRNKELNRFLLVRKVWDEQWGEYRWKEV